MRKTTTLVLALVLGACGQAAHEARPESDRARDANRKPAEVLEFIGIKPGMIVLDMFSGGGYYTEILSYVVGEEFEQRYLGGRLANAEVLMVENNELALEAESFDAIMLVLSFHDLYYENAENGWPRIDIETFLAELHKGLRAGGIVGIVDHVAQSG